jgi:hypothetical protein
VVNGCDTALIPDRRPGDTRPGHNGENDESRRLMMNNRYRRIIAVAGLAAAAIPLGAGSASAWTSCEDARTRCVADSGSVGAADASPYAEPLATLGGRTLAEYLAELRILDFRLIRTGS